MGSDSERLGCYGMVMSVFIAVLFSMPVLAAYSTGLPWLYAAAVLVVIGGQVTIVSTRTGVEQVICQIALLAQIFTAALMLEDWLGLTFWSGLPIHFVALVLTYVLVVWLPFRIAPSSGGTRRI